MGEKEMHNVLVEQDLSAQGDLYDRVLEYQKKLQDPKEAKLIEKLGNVIKHSNKIFNGNGPDENAASEDDSNALKNYETAVQELRETMEEEKELLNIKPGEDNIGLKKLGDMLGVVEKFWNSFQEPLNGFKAEYRKLEEHLRKQLEQHRTELSDSLHEAEKNLLDQEEETDKKVREGETGEQVTAQNTNPVP